MAEFMFGQICERQSGDPKCPFHPENDVLSLCEECSVLVCVDCMTSLDHRSHPFTKLSDITNKKINDIAGFIENIKESFLPKVCQLVAEIEEKEKALQEAESSLLNEHSVHFEYCLEELQKTKESMENEIQSFCDEQYKQLAKVKHNFQAIKKKFECILNELQHVLNNGTEVETYDTSISIKKNEKEIDHLPRIPDIAKITLEFSQDNAKKLVEHALGVIKKLYARTPKHKQHMCVSTPFKIKSFEFYAVTPVTEISAWCAVLNKSNINKRTNKLFLVLTHGAAFKKLETNVNIIKLCLSPATGELYGSFENQTIGTIDIRTGSTTVLINCPYKPDRLTVTFVGDIIVGEDSSSGYVYRYSSDGRLLFRTSDTFNVCDISNNDINDHVAIACGINGMTVLDRTLNNVIHTSKIECSTAVFDIDGSLLIGDCSKKIIHILDGKTFSTTKTLSPQHMSSPFQIRISDNSIWVYCHSTDKIIHITFQ